MGYFKHTGIITFDPRALSNGDKLFKPWWMIITMKPGDEIDSYYRWFVERHYGLRLQRPAFGPHISVIRNEETSQENWDKYKEKYNGKEIEFEHSGEIRTNGNHWWVRTYCDNLKDLREEMGYERNGMWGLHLTLGMPIPVQHEHSFYIWDCIKRFEMDMVDIDWKKEMELKINDKKPNYENC
jgi:hypothetical protein